MNIFNYGLKSKIVCGEYHPLLQELCFGECEALGLWQAGYGHIWFDLRWDDRSQGAKNLRFACEHGRGLAFTNLGVSYGENMEGCLISKNHFYNVTCNDWRRRGGSSCISLADNFEEGKGVPVDLERSAALRERARELDL